MHSLIGVVLPHPRPRVLPQMHRGKRVALNYPLREAAVGWGSPNWTKSRTFVIRFTLTV